MQIRHYAWVIWHFLWLILLGTIICGGATYIISTHIKPVYQASALIRVNEAGVTSSSSDIFSNQALAVGDALLVTSSDVLEEVTKKLPGTNVAQLKNIVSASPIANTEIIEVRAQTDNPQLAANIANEVVTAFIQIQTAKKETQLQNIIDRLSQNLTTAKTNVDTAQAQLNSLQKSGASTDKIAEQNTILNGYQANYNALQENYQQMQLQKTQVSNTLIPAQTALPPNMSSSPRILLNTLIAASLSLLLMIVLAFILDWSDATIKTSEDVAQLALMEPLGSIPFSEQPLSLDKSSNISVNDRAIEQACMLISINFSTLNKDKRSIIVTSPHKGSGTSTVASRLALSLAQSGRRVLLIDANLHRPSLHDVFKCQNMKGLTNVLNDVYSIQKQPDLIHSWLSQWTTQFPNLWLLPSGPGVADATVVLRSLELPILIGWLLQPQQSFSNKIGPRAIDMIIFDTPTIEDGVDTIMLTPLTDGIVLTVEAAKERSETLNKINATFEKLDVSVAGVVVNRQKAQHRSYFYVNHSQQFKMKSRPTNLPVKYPLFKTPTLLSETPTEIPSRIPIPQETRLLPDTYDVNRYTAPSIQHSVKRTRSGLFDS